MLKVFSVRTIKLWNTAPEEIGACFSKSKSAPGSPLPTGSYLNHADHGRETPLGIPTDNRKIGR